MLSSASEFNQRVSLVGVDTAEHCNVYCTFLRLVRQPGQTSAYTALDFVT